MGLTMADLIKRIVDIESMLAALRNEVAALKGGS